MRRSLILFALGLAGCAHNAGGPQEWEAGQFAISQLCFLSRSYFESVPHKTNVPGIIVFDDDANANGQFIITWPRYQPREAACVGGVDGEGHETDWVYAIDKADTFLVKDTHTGETIKVVVRR